MGGSIDSLGQVVSRADSYAIFHGSDRVEGCFIRHSPDSYDFVWPIDMGQMGGKVDSNGIVQVTSYSQPRCCSQGRTSGTDPQNTCYGLSG